MQFVKGKWVLLPKKKKATKGIFQLTGEMRMLDTKELTIIFLVRMILWLCKKMLFLGGTHSRVWQ